MSAVRVQLKRVGAHVAAIPTAQTEHSAGFDLAAAIAEEIVLRPGERVLIGTGLAFAIPPGYEGQVRPRSGLALKHGITVLNAPGTIDADYRGEVKVVLVHHGKEPYAIQPNERIAQLLIAPTLRVEFDLVPTLDETSRGDGGYGSTGRS